MADAACIGEIDTEYLLEENEDYESIEDYIESEGVYDLVNYENDHTWKLINVHPIYVAEYDEEPENPYGDDDGFVQYDSDFGYEIDPISIDNGGLTYIQRNEYLGYAFVVKVSKSHTFTPGNMRIMDGGASIEYNGVKYDSASVCGDDNGEYEFYLNGELASCEE